MADDDIVVTSKTEQATKLLRDFFTGGAFAPGAQLPSEADLTARFGTSRTTVRRALEKLRAEGVIHTEHGRGSFVTDARAAQTITRTPNPWDSLEPASDPEMERPRASALIAELFAVPEGSPTFVRKQLATRRQTGARVLTRRTLAAKPILALTTDPNPAGDRAPLIAALEADLGPLTVREQHRYIPTPPASMADDLGAGPGAVLIEYRHLTYGRARQLLMVETECSEAGTAAWEHGI